MRVATPGKNKTPATGFWNSGAGNETRTRDPDLGKVVLYQLSYSRGERLFLAIGAAVSTLAAGLGDRAVHPRRRIVGQAARR